MLTTPILHDVDVFNADKEYSFDFTVIGGSQVIGNRLIIERVDNNVVVYDEIQETFNLKHKLPDNTLTNGVSYKARVQTTDIEGNWSDFSNIKIFWCYSEPNIEILTIDYDNENRVYNQTVLFESRYSQAEGESLESYQYLLYDYNQDLIEAFPRKFSEGDTLLTQEITGLENSVVYFLEVKTSSPNNHTYSTGLIPFRPFYVAPQLNAVMKVRNVPDIGSIKIEANIVQITMKLYDDKGYQIPYEEVEYVDDEWLDMTRQDYDKLVADEGFETFNDDFILQIWCKNIPDEKVFLRLYAPNGMFEMFKSRNRIRVYKTIPNTKIKPYYASNEFEVIDNQEITIYMKHVNHRVDLKVEPV